MDTRRWPRGDALPRRLGKTRPTTGSRGLEDIRPGNQSSFIHRAGNWARVVNMPTMRWPECVHFAAHRRRQKILQTLSEESINAIDSNNIDGDCSTIHFCIARAFARLLQLDHQSRVRLKLINSHSSTHVTFLSAI